MKTIHGKHLPLILFSCCLLVTLSACGQQAGATNAYQGTSTNTSQMSLLSTQSSNAPAQTVPMPPTQTACPADGSARAAIMKPLALGKHQSLVYIYNEIPLNTTIAYGHLKRYDQFTQQKADIVTSGLSIQSAQVSADGEWVLFLSTPDPRGDTHHSAMLQLVRMDGQGLQTLYCFPTVTGGNEPGMNNPTVQWSVDQRSILFSYDVDKFTSVITLLDVATGKLKPEIKYTDTNQLYHYNVAFWLDNTSAYVEKTGRFGPQPPIEFDLLNTTTNKDLNGGDLKKVLEHSVRFSNLSFDSSYDGTQLFVSYCLQAANPVDTTITAGPATGGTQKVIYHQAQTVCTKDLRAVSSTTLLITAQTYNTSAQKIDRNQAWTMKPDGSAKKILFDLPVNGNSFSLNATSQNPWANLSRDGNFYAVQSTNNNTHESAVFVGALIGGTPSGVADVTHGDVSIAGWTTM